MKGLKVVSLAVLTAAATAAPLLAGPRLCGSGATPKLSGDMFSPVDCSTTTKSAIPLPGLPLAHERKEEKTDLKDLSGRWEGVLIHALGRYELLLDVKTRWGGKAELTLAMKELQFRERLTDRLVLSSAKGRGAYKAILTTTVLPDASLTGILGLGAASPPLGEENAVPDRQADIIFPNGSSHRLYFALKGPSEMRIRAFSSIPGAPLQKYEVELRRTTREAL